MILFKKAADLADHLAILAQKQLKTGFVPTLGALHEGHLLLIAQSRKRTGITICSIFVNPAQFNDPADFAKYPVTIEQDILKLEQAGCDILFFPSVNEIYPDGMGGPELELGFIDTVLEGSKRPGHFKGVYKVMHRLLRIVEPDILYLGQKDYQQCMVIGQLIEKYGWPIELDIVPTVRETSGLAMSSRNTRLSADAKERATIIYRALQFMKDSLVKGSVGELTETAARMILAEGFEKIDYVTVADAKTLEPIDIWDGKSSVVALVAAFIDSVRLIDNIILF